MDLMLSCEQCKAYMVEGQVECGICGFDPTKPPEPEPVVETAQDRAADRAADERREIQALAKSGASTPFALLGLVVIGVVGYLILSGSNVFGTGSGEPETPAALALITEDTELSSWNNDVGGPVGIGDEQLVIAMSRSCRRGGAAVDGVSPYRRVAGAHPVAIVDLRFGSAFDGTGNALQRQIVPRQVSPTSLRDSELLLCATDADDPGITTLDCPLSDTPGTDDPKVSVELPGNDTTYRLIVAATGEVLWSHTKVFSENLVDSCDTTAHLIGWSRDRVEFPDPYVWTEVAQWAVGRGPDPEPTESVSDDES